jgi:hypothetical protein
MRQHQVATYAWIFSVRSKTRLKKLAPGSIHQNLEYITITYVPMQPSLPYLCYEFLLM